MKSFRLASRAAGDLQEIWNFVAEDSFDAADRILEDLYRAFEQLADMPGLGHRRSDLTNRPVLFWPIHSYLVIYANSTPLRIVRIVHGKRDVSRLLK